MRDYFLRNVQIVLPDDIRKGGNLVVRNGLIERITDDPSAGEGLPSVDGEGRYAVPAPVEIHFHGIGDYGFDQEDEDVVEKIAGELARRGTACFVPGFTWHEAILSRCVREIERKPALRDRIPGLLLEGPFVSPEKLGGIQPSCIRKPDVELLDRILDLCRGMLKMMTVAPELPGIERIIDRLLEKGVIPCLGHSNATVRQGLEAARRGRLSMTHLFNAMSPISHKTPGLSLLPFLDREIYFELNADGIHVAPDLLRACHRALSRERLILITDAVVSAGKDYGRYRYHGMDVVSDARGVRYADRGTLIGSNLLLLDVVRNYVAVTGATLPEAVRMASLNPCRLLGIDDRRGSIAVGKRAELVLLEEDLRLARFLAG